MSFLCVTGGSDRRVGRRPRRQARGKSAQEETGEALRLASAGRIYFSNGPLLYFGNILRARTFSHSKVNSFPFLQVHI